MSAADRRRTPRVPCDLPVQWRRGGRTYHCRAADLNADGFFLRTEIPVALHYVMDLVIELPAGPVEIFGVARFLGRTRHGHGVGVTIHAVSKEQRDRWMSHYRAALADMVAALPRSIAQHF